jgi:hypothetical protein
VYNNREDNTASLDIETAACIPLGNIVSNEVLGSLGSLRYLV